MISIIIPTYNEEKYLGKTLENLASLKIPHEIIVTDDKSTDNTISVARMYTNNVLAPQEKHVTIAANRNAGASVAQGDFLVFMDSSCLIENPDIFFARALDDFKSIPHLVGLTAKLDVYPETRTWGDRLMYFIFNSTHFIKNNLLHTGEAAGKFQMVTRDAFKKIHGFREDLVTREDADLFHRLSKIGRTLYDSKLLVIHSGRRAHALGWPKLLSIWMINSFWLVAFGTAKAKNWERWWEKPTASVK